MHPEWAAENLQVIRTLMERSAIYRRALTPMMLLTGAVGAAAALVGAGLNIDSPQGFLCYWLAVSLAPLVGCFVLVRRQALKEAEPLWSPPARRVAQAVLPPLVAGMVVSCTLLVRTGQGADFLGLGRKIALSWVPVGWVILYGCAIHAAGFFMPRGIKLFGWLFIAGGCGAFVLNLPDGTQAAQAHGLMGFFFGLLHLAYGVYLYFTEKQPNAA